MTEKFLPDQEKYLVVRPWARRICSLLTHGEASGPELMTELEREFPAKDPSLFEAALLALHHMNLLRYAEDGRGVSIYRYCGPWGPLGERPAPATYSPTGTAQRSPQEGSARLYNVARLRAGAAAQPVGWDFRPTDLITYQPRMQWSAVQEMIHALTPAELEDQELRVSEFPSGRVILVARGSGSPTWGNDPVAARLSGSGGVRYGESSLKGERIPDQCPYPSIGSWGAPLGYEIDPGAGSGSNRLCRAWPTAAEIADIRRRGGEITPLYSVSEIKQ